MDGVTQERETSLNRYHINPTDWEGAGISQLQVDADFWEVDTDNNLSLYIGEPKDAKRIAYFPSGLWWAIRER